MPHIFPAFVFQLVHQPLQHGIFGEIKNARCICYLQPSPKNLFNGIAVKQLKIGVRQFMQAPEAEQLLMPHIAAATAAYLWKEQVMLPGTTAFLT